MSTRDVPFEPGQPESRPKPEDALLEDDYGAIPPDWLEGVDLKPTTLESLVTWDVSAHARRDQERLRSATARIHGATPSDR